MRDILHWCYSSHECHKCEKCDAGVRREGTARWQRRFMAALGSPAPALTPVGECAGHGEEDGSEHGGSG
jgi:hypothetical protein